MGIVLTSVAIRLLFMPLSLYTQKLGMKYRLIEQDMEDIKSRAERLSGDPEAQKEELIKLALLKQKHGIKISSKEVVNKYIYFLRAIFHILQIPIHTSVFILCNEISLNCHIYPSIETDGFLWFSDLSYPDTLCILPIAACLLSFLNIMSTSMLSL